jgi:tRNA A37 methylthiotransferase MiaB
VALRCVDPDLGAAVTTSVAKKVFIKTFGCQMNEYDSAKMVDVLHAARGYEPTSNVDEADLILFNTCSVREKAQEKVFSDLGRVKHLKAKGTLIGVGGCVASQEGEALVRRAPYVDIVFGPQTLHRLPELIDQASRGEPCAGRHPLSRRSRSSTTCRQRESTDRRHSCRSWKGARSTAATAWFRIHAAKRCRGRSTTC